MGAKIREKIKKIFDTELSKLQLLEHSFQKWQQLERLHIIGQSVMRLHYQVHFQMLKLAFKEGRSGEIFGQILRIVLVLPGHLFGRLPSGNVGTSRVSAFKKMELPEDIRDSLN